MSNPHRGQRCSELPCKVLFWNIFLLHLGQYTQLLMTRLVGKCTRACPSSMKVISVPPSFVTVYGYSRSRTTSGSTTTGLGIGSTFCTGFCNGMGGVEHPGQISRFTLWYCSPQSLHVYGLAMILTSLQFVTESLRYSRVTHDYVTTRH